MANATVGALRVLLTANSAEFEAVMKQSAKAAQGLSKDLKSFGQQASAVGSALTKALTVPILGLGAGAIKAASDFESSFAGVRKTVDATEPEFAKLAQGLRNMAKEVPANVNELNKVAESAGQLGIKKEDILQFTRTMADLGVTTNLTADQAATATAQFQNIFGAAGKDVDRFGATLVALGNAGASTERDIIEMGLRIAGAGHQVGLTQGQVLAFASSLSSVGINAEAGGSAISRVFLKINDAVMSGGDRLAEFARIAGMSSAEFKDAFERDAAGATTAFIAGLGRLKGEGENVNATIEGVVGKNIILKDTLLRASGAGSLLTDNLKLQAQAWNENAALTKEASERYKTFESQLQLLWNEIRDVGITLGTSLLPVMRDLLSLARPVIQGVSEMAEWFAKLPEPVRMVAVGMGGLFAAIGPSLWMLGEVAQGGSAILKAYSALVAGDLLGKVALGFRSIGVAAAAGAPAILAVAAAAAVVAAAYTRFSSDGQKVVEVLDKLTAAEKAEYAAQQKLGLGWEYLEQKAKEKANTLDALGTKTLSTAAAYDEFKGVVDQVAATMQTGGAAVVNFGDTTTDTGTKVKDATKALREYYNWIGERQMEAAAEGIRAQEAFAASVTRTVSGFTPFAPTVKSAADEVRAFGGALSDLASGSLLEFGLASTKARTEAEAWAFANGAVLAPSVKQVTATSVIEAGKTVGAWATAMAGLPNVIIGAIQGGGSVIAAAGSHIGQSLMTSFSKTYGPAIKAALPLGLGEAVTAMLPVIGTLLGPLAKKVGDWFKNIFGGPSGAELAGRQRVAEFEDELHGILTAQQEAEAGGEAWKKTVIAIRDAYIAMGRTEEEALADAKRLWESSKQGPEAVARVIEEIKRKMKELTSGTHVIDVEVKYTDGEPGNEGPRSTTQPTGEPSGFGVGTMGRFGEWFGNFGAGVRTSLHGIEAVLRPQDAMPFAMDVLANAAGGRGGNTTTTTQSLVVTPVVMGDGRSPLAIARDVVRHIVDSALPMNEEGLTSAIEAVITNHARTYAHG